MSSISLTAKTEQESGMITKIRNAVLIMDILETEKNLYIRDDTITAVTEENLPCDRVIDAKGLYVSPGFIDIHTHGGGGYRFEGSTDEIVKACDFHLKHALTVGDVMRYFAEKLGYLPVSLVYRFSRYLKFIHFQSLRILYFSVIFRISW